MNPARWWEARPDGRIVCGLCPRRCRLREGQAGFCGVRSVASGRLQTQAYGGYASLAVDPVEKKPFYHLRPGSSTLSFGTLGCTLGCAFCQNAALSQTFTRAEMRALRPEGFARTARDSGCSSVAFTYNEPFVSAEWTLEVAQACRAAGLLALAVTSGFVSPEPLAALMPHLDAANVDLKAFSESFYRTRCAGSLAPVLESLQAMAAAGLWLEITTLLIPGENDSEGEIRSLATWIREHLGSGSPLHLTAFHPAHRLADHPSTRLDTLRQARAWAREEGLAFVYTGNLPDPEGQTTWCPACGEGLIQRQGFRMACNGLRDSLCPTCSSPIPGRWG